MISRGLRLFLMDEWDRDGSGARTTATTGAFDANSIPNLKAWFRADSLTLSDGDPVGTWTDSSLNANNVTQATTSKKPTFKTGIINGKPVVRFDGVDDELSKGSGGVSGAAPHTIIAVAKGSPAGHYAAFACLGSGAGNTSALGLTDSGLTWVGGIGDGTAGTVLRTGAFHVFTKRCQNDGTGSSMQAFVDGTTETIASPGSVDTIIDTHIGIGTAGDDPAVSNNIALADIAEVLIYSGALSTTDRQTVERYLGTKYGIAVS